MKKWIHRLFTLKRSKKRTGPQEFIDSIVGRKIIGADATADYEHKAWRIDIVLTGDKGLRLWLPMEEEQ